MTINRPPADDLEPPAHTTAYCRRCRANRLFVRQGLCPPCETALALAIEQDRESYSRAAQNRRHLREFNRRRALAFAICRLHDQPAGLEFYNGAAEAAWLRRTRRRGFERVPNAFTFISRPDS